MKIYSSGNNFVIEYKGITYSSFYKNVIISQVFGINGNVPYYNIKNVQGWDENKLINIEDVTNDTGMYYTADTFEDFFETLIQQDPIESPLPEHIESISVQDKENWTTAFTKRITGVSITGSDTKTLTLTFADNTKLTASFPDEKGTSTTSDGNDYVDSLNFNSATGMFTVGRTGTLSDITINLDGRYLTSIPSHSHEWTDITGAPEFLLEETDPTVPAHVKAITETNIANWNSNSSSGTSLPLWTASAYTAGAIVSHNGTLWEAKVATLATDVPATGSKWTPKTDNVDGAVLHLEFETSDLIYTWKNYILEYVDGTSNDIRFSNDSGVTWTTWVNPYGHIARVHIFSEGTVMFCTTTRVFTTKNFVTVTESTVLDFGGAPFVPDAVHFFSIMPQLNPIVKIDGVEMVAWGDYMITQAAGTSAYISRYWYSTDYGKTLKCAIKEGVTVIGGQVFDVRHIHGYAYDTHRNRFVISSGDDNNDTRLIESIYTPSTDTWEHKLLQKGVLYKFGCIYFDETFTYFTTDYTESGKIRGIKRCPSDRLDDSTAYQYIYRETTAGDVTPLIAYYEDSNGNRIMTGDDLASGKIYYAKGDFNFKTVTHNQNVPMGMITSVNYQGDQYAQLFASSYQAFSTVRRKYVNLTKAFRNAGVYDFNQEKFILGRNESTTFADAKSGSFIGTTIKLHVEGNVYNYNTPSTATSYSISLVPLPKVNSFARCFIKAATEPVVNVPSGTVERVSLQIESIPTTAGNITITLNGVATPVVIDPAIETTTKLVAAKIKNTVFTGWTTALGGAYDANGGFSNVTFTSTTEGTKTDATYSAGTTGTTGKIQTVEQGSADTVATKIGDVAFIANTTMEMVIESPIRGVYEYYFLKR